MDKHSYTVENYLKAIYKISEREHKAASTSAISKEMQTSAASVTDMLKRLSEKELINYEKYKGVSLTKSGKEIATQLIRKHRLWESFLVEKLDFKWEEVHDIAEELEHIQSEELINRLDAFLSFPKFDPHGDPIPNKEGRITLRRQMPLSDASLHSSHTLVGVFEHSTPFLEYLNEIGIQIGSNIEVLEKVRFDNSMKVNINNKNTATLSYQVASNLFVK